MDKDELLDKLAKAIIAGDERAASEIAQEILKARVDPSEAIFQGAIKGLDIVGDRFERLEMFLPELILAGDAMKACLAVFRPHFNPQKMAGFMQTKVVIGTVSGDIHDIGKNLVANMLSITGFEVHDLGIDVPVKHFIETAEEVKAKVLALSALLTLTAYYQEEVIKYLKDAGLREKYYVVVGGAPINEDWAAQIGADGYARDAVGATKLLKRLVTEAGSPPLPQPLVVK